MRIVARVLSSIRPFLLAGGLLALLAPSAAGWSAPQLTSQITDQTGVLGSGQDRVQSALDDLLSHQNVQLWVVLISTTSGATAANLATGTFTANGFGGNDMVLLIAVNDHRYGWAEDGATGLPAFQIDDLASSEMEPYFRDGDYSGGLVAFANALGQKIDAARAPDTKPTANTAIAPPDSGGTPVSIDTSGLTTFLWVLIGLIVIIIGLVLMALWFRAWKRGRLSAEERDKKTGDLARQANKLLVDTDDAIHEAVQEIGFAEAEFDESDVKPYRDAVDAAQAELKAAFEVRQQLDDSTPEDPPTRVNMYGAIISHCQAAGARLDEQAKRLAALRDLEKTAPAALAELPKTIESLKSRLPAIQEAVKTLAEYAPSSWAAVKGNAEEADKRGHFAEGQIEQGKAALAAKPPNRAAAARAARAAQEAVAQANQLLDAVGQMASTLKDAEAKLDQEMAAAQADIEAARAAIADKATAGTASSAADLARAEDLIKTAKRQDAARPPDPLSALKSAQDAHATADTVLAGIREKSSQAARARAAFDVAHASAVGRINEAQAFISSRRNGVGATARTRLAEAQRHLSQADELAATDIGTATTEANMATNLAASAYTLASGDFVDFERGGPPRGSYGSGGGGSYGGGYGGGGDGGAAQATGAILGGIIGGILGSGRGGGFGGTPWGSSGGWSGGGSSGGSGGFGGFGGHSGGGGWAIGGGGGGGGGVHSGGGGW